MLISGEGSNPPRTRVDPETGEEYLVIDVPHLIAALRRAYDEFRASPRGRSQRAFAARMQQTIFDEDDTYVHRRKG